MSVRSASRFLALQAVYEVEVGKVTSEEALEHVQELQGAGPEAMPFCRTLVEGSLREKDASLQLIAEHLSEKWTLARVGTMEKLILRQALFELHHCPEVPTPVILNEALELTRDFLDDKAVKFINGLLDRMARLVRPQSAPESLATAGTPEAVEVLEDPSSETDEASEEVAFVEPEASLEDEESSEFEDSEEESEDDSEDEEAEDVFEDEVRSELGRIEADFEDDFEDEEDSDPEGIDAALVGGIRSEFE